MGALKAGVNYRTCTTHGRKNVRELHPRIDIEVTRRYDQRPKPAPKIRYAKLV